jgi:GPN-loop GTPase
LEHCESIGRSAHLINLDPAAENFVHPPSKDIRDLISVDEVMEELQYGPNGGLIFALEYMLSEGLDWLQDDLGEYQDEFLIIDCPGQIEIYSHFDIMPRIIEIFLRADYRACAVYLLESQWMEEPSKFFAGILNATAAMLQLGIPHLNLISKMDICIDKKLSKPRDEMSPGEIEEEEEIICDVLDETNPLHNFFFPNPEVLEKSLESTFTVKSKFSSLNFALLQLIEEFDMVNFIPLNVRNESSLAAVLSHIDNATQYAENLEPKDPEDVEDVDLEDDEGYEEYKGYGDYKDDGDNNDKSYYKDKSDYESNLDYID